MVTLSGEGDWEAILWQWDQFKMLARCKLGVMDPLDSISTASFQISLFYTNKMVCVVTGTNTYRFLTLEENMKSFKENHSQIVPRGHENISTDYTAHCWAKD